MTRTKESVVALIREAFRDVSLGNGYGLRKAEALDHYGDVYTRERAELDEKEKAEGWQSLQAKNLDKYHNALVFFDPEGMRFHLPAYMIYDLEEFFKFADMRLYLSFGSDHKYKQFSLLTPEQRNAVREFLLYVKDEMDEGVFGYSDIQATLKSYWTPE